VTTTRWFIVALFALFLPFLGKAPVVDEESYLFMANAIAEHPFEPYDWWRNWQPWGSEISSNSFHFAHPPLHLWWMTLWHSLVGEGPLLRFLVAAPWILLFGISAANLAKTTTRNPILVLLVCFSSPVLLLGLHDSMMIDLGVLALSTASVATYRQALSTRGKFDRRKALHAGLFLGLACSYKYPALLLLLLYLVHLHRLGLLKSSQQLWLGFFAVFGGIQAYLALSYGQVHLLTALQSATDLDRSSVPQRSAGMFVRLGFALSPLLLLSGPHLRRYLLPGAGIGLLSLWSLGRGDLETPGILALLVFATAGGAFFTRGIVGAWPQKSRGRRQRDREDGLLLGGWATLVLLSIMFGHNYSDSRYLLPALLPLSLLVVRSSTQQAGAKPWIRIGSISWAALGLVVAIADYRFASASQELAQTIAKEHQPARFSAEWTIRHTLEKQGWRFWHPSNEGGDYALQPGEKVVIFQNGGSSSPPENAKKILHIRSPEHFPLRLLDAEVDAGYHSEGLGRLPIGWGSGSMVEATIYEVANTP